MSLDGIDARHGAVPVPIAYFSFIDALRGLAALSVLIWHYQHFYIVEAGASLLGNSPWQPPFLELLRFFYTKGELGAQVFWMISGFIFANTYLQSKETSAHDFILKRFARLYPLHLATLFIVALLQFVSFRSFGYHQIYATNDATHFVLHLFLASNWWGGSPLSFNGPVWSLSVEIVVYAIFFCAISILRQNMIKSCLAAGLFMVLFCFTPYSIILHCGLYFFSGTAIFFIFRRYLLVARGAAISIAICASAVALALASFSKMEEVAAYCASVALVIACASLDNAIRKPSRIVKGIGNISYSCYLIHVPVQIALLMLMDTKFIARDVINKPVFFVAFVTLVITLAYFTYRFFEKPMQIFITDRFALRRGLIQAA
jgi:peptidoglycan/LPS O-acetylase OafA/YrhL